MTNQHLERARQLLHMDRLTDAETELKKALQQNPNEPMAFALLADCHIEKNEFAEAVDMAKLAVKNNPGEPYYYLILARSNFYNKNIPTAKTAIEEGQRLDPSNAQFFLLRSEIAFYKQDWKLALEEANKGLELDAENVHLVNHRAQTLIKLNRKEEASTTMDYALHKAPESSFSHANKGWVNIEKGAYEEAIKNFLEALRLDPNNEFAREGLKEAIKAKNPIYAAILKYFLWMNKLQEKYQWGFIIGIYVLYRIAIKVAENNPAIAPFLYPFIVFYILFAFSTWIAMPVSNLFLRLHSIGKHALNKDEILGSNLTGLMILVSVLGFSTYFITDAEIGFRTGLISGIMLIPIGGAFTIPEKTKARKNLSAYAALLALIGLWWILIPNAGIAILIFALGVFAYGWVANYFISKSNKEFF